MVDQQYKSPLNEAGVVALLMRLFENGEPMILDDLKDIVPNYDTRKKRIAELERIDLVTETLAMIPRKAILVGLTSKGKEAVLMLSRVVNLTQGDLPIKDRTIGMKYAVPVIRMVNDRKVMKVAEILEQLPFHTPIKKKLIPAMEESGIGRAFKEETGHKAEYVELTALGKMMALGLDEMQNIIDKAA